MQNLNLNILNSIIRFVDNNPFFEEDIENITILKQLYPFDIQFLGQSESFNSSLNPKNIIDIMSIDNKTLYYGGNQGIITEDNVFSAQEITQKLFFINMIQSGLFSGKNNKGRSNVFDLLFLDNIILQNFLLYINKPYSYLLNNSVVNPEILRNNSNVLSAYTNFILLNNPEVFNKYTRSLEDTYLLSNNTKKLIKNVFVNSTPITLNNDYVDVYVIDKSIILPTNDAKELVKLNNFLSSTYITFNDKGSKKLFKLVGSLNNNLLYKNLGIIGGNLLSNEFSGKINPIAFNFLDEVISNLGITRSNIESSDVNLANLELTPIIATEIEPIIDLAPPTELVKEGVLELFKSNPELANEVYEALGFNKQINSNVEEILIVDKNEIPKKDGESFSEMQKRVTQNINIRKRIEIANKNNIIQGKSYSYSEIKKLFNNDNLFTNEIYNQLSIVLQSSNLDFKFGSLNQGKKTTNAYYNSISNSINIDTLVLQTPNLATSDFKRILLHEIIHAATFINLKENAILTSTQKTALNNLNNLIVELNKDRDFFAQYGLTNANELLAELANEQFVDKLKNKKFNDNQSFFDKIISEIVKLLGLKTTAYDIVKESFDNLVKDYKNNNQITPQQKQQTLQLYSQYLEQNPNGNIKGFKEFVEKSEPIQPTGQEDFSSVPPCVD